VICLCGWPSDISDILDICGHLSVCVRSPYGWNFADISDRTFPPIRGMSEMSACPSRTTGCRGEKERKEGSVRDTAGARGDHKSRWFGDRWVVSPLPPIATR
jgi:hypothetical protein